MPYSSCGAASKVNLNVHFPVLGRGEGKKRCRQERDDFLKVQCRTCGRAPAWIVLKSFDAGLNPSFLHHCFGAVGRDPLT